MKLIFAALSVLALTSSVLSQTRNPDPCLAATTDFVNDYSSCDSYFWCRPAAQGGTTPTYLCDPGLGFNEVAQVCDTASAESPPCLECPAEGDIAVAVAGDLTCMTYNFCSAGVRNPEVVTCESGTLFNRVTGMCDLTANVRCFGAGGTTPPSASCVGPTGELITGDVNSAESCASFIQCANGVAVGTFLCSAGLHFNPATNTCSLPAALETPCVDPAVVFGSLRVVKQDHSKAQTLRDRFMSRLHLKN